MGEESTGVDRKHGGGASHQLIHSAHQLTVDEKVKQYPQCVRPVMLRKRVGEMHWPLAIQSCICRKLRRDWGGGCWRWRRDGTRRGCRP